MENTSLYIARKLSGAQNSGHRLSRLTSRIAMVSVALSTAVMVIAMAVIAGFQMEIKSKAVGLTGHILLSNYDANTSFETQPIDLALADIPSLLKIKGIDYAQPVGTKGGIIKTDDEVQGAVLKGIDATFNPRYFREYIVEGAMPVITDTATSNEVLVPLRLARQLHLTTGSSFDMYFIQDPPRVRRFTISGLYNAPLEDMTDVLIVGDLRHVRRLNGWTSAQAGSVEVFVDDIDRLDPLAAQVDDMMSYNITEDGVRLKVQTVADLYPQLFDWLNLLDMNVAVLLVLVLLVAGFNMISGLLIIVFEKTAMVGLLKALGMRNTGVQRIFLYRTAFITLKGMCWGNVIGLGCCLLQQWFHLFPLDPSMYYVDSAPILLRFWPLLAVNVFGFLGITLLQALPVLVISYISPDKTIKRD